MSSSATTTPPQFLSRSTQSLTATCRPWSLFLDLSSLNLPSSIPDATTRVSQNLTHFRSNYILILLLILFLTLIFHPLSLLAFLIILLGWLSLYFNHSADEPLTILGFEVNGWFVLIGLCAATVVVLAWSGVFLNIVVAGAIGVVLILVHAVLRSTDDLVGDETSPYGNFLDDDDDDDVDPRGAYTGI